MGYYDEEDDAEYFTGTGLKVLSRGALVRRMPQSGPDEPGPHRENRRWAVHEKDGWNHIHERSRSSAGVLQLLDLLYERGDLQEVEIRKVPSGDGEG